MLSGSVGPSLARPAAILPLVAREHTPHPSVNLEKPLKNRYLDFPR